MNRLRIHLFFSLLFLLSLEVQAQDAASTPQTIKESKVGVGIGFGIPYGILGVNVDFVVAPNLNLTAGLGTSTVDLGYSFGAKYFFSDVSHSFRPRILALYGTNAVLWDASGWDNDKSYTGLSLGAGAQWMWGESKSNGLDFDIIFIATTGLDVNDLKNQGIIVDEPGKIKFSIGYRHMF